jgi:hypothetical protein
MLLPETNIAVSISASNTTEISAGGLMWMKHKQTWTATAQWRGRKSGRHIGSGALGEEEVVEEEVVEEEDVEEVVVLEHEDARDQHTSCH